MAAQDYLIFLCGMLLGAMLAWLLLWLYYRKRFLDVALVSEHMKASFAAISKDTLIANVDLMNSSFRQSLEQLHKSSEQERSQSQELLKNVLSPLKESLGQVDKKVQELENARMSAFGGLKEQIEGLLKSQQILQKEANNLSRALSAPSVRGRWGEMQLRRVVELSGLSAHCDFLEQESVKGEHEMMRPDMIVTLPNKKMIVVDAKAPLELFAEEHIEKAKEAQMAGALRRHLLALRKKEYYKIVNGSPEFSVMFLPSEAFLHRALLADSSLLDFAAQNDVIIVTPITLIALLKAVSFGFKQEAVAENIDEARRLSQQLIDRIHKVAEHFDKLGRHLAQASQCFNQTLSSLDSRVLVTARKLAEIKSVGMELKETRLEFIEDSLRPAILGETENKEAAS
jgi:DNA recombination protein RmuC